MRSLFAKILLWFLATIGITLIGLAVTAAYFFNSTRTRQLPFAMLLTFEEAEARHAWETGGRDALASTLARFRAGRQSQGIFTDASGRDLVTGEDRSALIHKAEGPQDVVLGERVVLAHHDEEGNYWYLLLLPRRSLFWFLHPQYLWIVGVVVLLSYMLALHLTSPLRQLETAVECFGRGDFSARSRSERKDELGQLARTFDQMAERIQTLLAAERRLLLDVSHELRSPLARLSVAVELARSGENRESALNRIEKESERLNELVGGLLQVTRAEGDPAVRRTDPVQLDELVSEVVEDCLIEAEARGSALQLAKVRPVVVAGDSELIRRAVENVVRNAIRYAPPQTAVEIQMNGGPGKACIQVRDFGPGVPEEELPRIFDPFYRVGSDRNRSSGGAGLGLSIARRAVELHHGKLSARNANPGLMVEIELPASVA